MLIKILKFAWILAVFQLSSPYAFSQHVSRDKYKGDWENSQSWDNGWDKPLYNISGENISIYGYITSDTSISFYNASSTLRVHDTLVINGDLSFHNNNDLVVFDGGILIVKGNFSIEEHSLISIFGYLIVTGNIIKDNLHHVGMFISDDNPPKVFLGGTCDPPGITENFFNYPVLDCTGSFFTPYPNSGCSTGNMLDLANQPIYDFFKSTCALLSGTTALRICEGKSLTLTAPAGRTYSWTGPRGYISNTQNPVIPVTDTGMSGAYIVTISSSPGCTAADTILVTIDPTPSLAFTSSDDTLCIPAIHTLTASPEGGVFNLESGDGTISENTLSVSNAGDMIISYSYTNRCAAKTYQTLVASPVPSAYAGPDQELDFIFESQLHASLPANEQGTWTVISGFGEIESIGKADSKVKHLSLGDNRFKWNVSNGSCESADEVIIHVNDLFIPSVITPNGDGKNDCFKINLDRDDIELVVFNEWGLTEYQNKQYKNEWCGKDSHGHDLPEGTYYFILKPGDGITHKGTILIKR